MLINLEAKIKRAPEYGMEKTDTVSVTLEGDFEALIELLRKLNFTLDMARELTVT